MGIIKAGLPKILTCSKKVFKSARTVALGVGVSAPLESIAPISVEAIKYNNGFMPNLINYTESYLHSNSVFLQMRDILVADMNTGLFKKALVDNKKNLMNDLKIKSNKYDEYSKIAVKIGEDLSEYSDLEGLDFYERNPFLSENLEKFPVLSGFYNRGENRLIDLTRFVVDSPTPNEQHLFNKYKIDLSDPAIEPQKCAALAIIHLARLDKTYPKYVERIEKLKPNLKDKSVQSAIQNSERILKNEDLCDCAIAHFLLNRMFERYQIADNPEIYDKITPNDMNDLRVFAKTVILDREDYLIQKWDKKPLIPSGKNGDEAVANILCVVRNNMEKL